MRTVVITGLGRCGTTAIMRMLDAGGAPVDGEAPDYEIDASIRPTETWWRSVRGRVVKILNPHRLPDFIFDPDQVAFVMLRRDPEMQALSQLKFLQHVGEAATFDRRSRRGMGAQIRQETHQSMQRLRHSACPTMVLSFEQLISNRKGTARALGEFMGMAGHQVDDRLMWPEIWRRTTDCLPDMLEHELLAQAPFLKSPF